MKIYATITVIGRDQSGVVARVTSFLFVQKANIEGLEEQVTRGQFGMTIQASWPANECTVTTIRAGLADLARTLGMEIKIRFIEPSRRQRFALLVTRETHCFDAILAACAHGQLKADPALVMSNHADLEPLAGKHKLPFVHVPWADRVQTSTDTAVPTWLPGYFSSRFPVVFHETWGYATGQNRRFRFEVHNDHTLAQFTAALTDTRFAKAG